MLCNLARKSKFNQFSQYNMNVFNYYKYFFYLLKAPISFCIIERSLISWSHFHITHHSILYHIKYEILNPYTVRVSEGYFINEVNIHSKAQILVSVTHTKKYTGINKILRVCVCRCVHSKYLSMTGSVPPVKCSKTGKWFWTEKEQVLCSTKRKSL